MSWISGETEKEGSEEDLLSSSPSSEPYNAKCGADTNWLAIRVTPGPERSESWRMALRSGHVPPAFGGDFGPDRTMSRRRAQNRRTAYVRSGNISNLDIP